MTNSKTRLTKHYCLTFNLCRQNKKKVVPEHDKMRKNVNSKLPVMGSYNKVVQFQIFNNDVLCIAV